MNKTMTINGKSYELPKFSFKDMCDLEEMGLDVSAFEKKPMSQGLIFAAFTMGCDLEEAAKEVQAHVENGGAVADIFTAMMNGLDSSGFFRKLDQKKAPANAKRTSGVKKPPQSKA